MAEKTPKKMLGFTSTIPVELALAGGWTPVDLNNRFITDPDAKFLIREAEELGLPRTLCAWIKGMYAWCLAHPEVHTVVGVTQGDCANTQALMELLTLAGREVISFDYPHSRQAPAMAAELAELAGRLGTDLNAAEKMRRDLSPLRSDLAAMDQMTWQKGLVSGLENHLWLLESSDFEGDPWEYHRGLKSFLAKAREREPQQNPVRVGILGVPTIMSDLHQVLEELGAQVVFNEVPRQFAMLPDVEPRPQNLVEQYLAYTYPYDIFARARDIRTQAAKRGLTGLVHYTQTFCYRQMQDVALREKLRIPILTLEGDKVGPVDARTRMRLDAFVDLLR